MRLALSLSLARARAALPLALALLVASALVTAAPARADDGYCDFVQGAASAESAISLAPEVFAQFGQIESPSVVSVSDGSSLRFLGGVRWSLSGVYEGLVLRARAKADCRRHQAFEHVRGETLYRALEARAKVLEEALPQAEKLLAQATADFEARRSTAQEATATRLRVEELRRTAQETRRAMRELPAPGGDASGALGAFHRADDDIERHDARLRRARGIDLNVRLGIDQFLESTAMGESASGTFAVVSLGVNLGVLFQGSGNARAAAGRRRLVRTGRDPISVEATNELVEATARRAQDTAALEGDLDRQMEALNRVGGDDSKRFRQILWFDLVKARAERAYHEAHLAALKQVLGS
ncbi:MAG TPA: hypothetical protein VNO30_11410 [Kofleriaceae bacterium]|nr:hypothetical protein [Kofleriaceae bacterium]